MQDTSSDQSPAATQGSSLSDDGFHSMSSSHSSSRSFATVTDSMSDLIITTGYESMYPETAATRSATNSQITNSPMSRTPSQGDDADVSGQSAQSAVYRTGSRAVNLLQQEQTSASIISGARELPIKTKETIATLANTVPAIADKKPHLGPASTRVYNVVLPPSTSHSLSPLSPEFVPKQFPSLLFGTHDREGGTHGERAGEKRNDHPDSHLRTYATPSPRSDQSWARIASAAEDPLIFADDGYDEDGSLKGMFHIRLKYKKIYR